MTTITLRSTKGSPLTNNEVDANFNALDSDKLEITAPVGSATIPAGTTAQRDGSPSAGFLRYNTTTNTFEGYHAAAWDTIGGGLDSALVLDIAAPNQTITAGVGLGGGGNGSTVTLNIDSAELLAYYESTLRHDNLSGFVSNEHIDHSGVTITAGTGLTGGGTIAATRTLNVIGGTGITANANDIATNDGEIVHDNLSGFVSNEHIDHSGVTITAGLGLTGGGTIAATRTLAVDSAQLVAYYNTSLVHDNLSGFVANEHIDHSGVTLTAGAGLTGGGTIAASRSFAVGAGTGVTVNANDVAIGQPVGTTDSVTFAGLYASGNVVVGGNLTINGTQTTVNSTTVQIDDKLFTLGDAAADSAGMNGGGIELSTTGGANPSILYFASGDKFQVTKNWDVQGNVTLSGTVDGVDVAGLEGRSIVAGAGLTGGGTLGASRTLNIGAGTGITVNANDISADMSAIVHDDLSGFVANEHIDHSGVTITAGAGLTGGGTIAATRTIDVVGGTGITANANDIQTNDGEIVHDNLSGFVANEHIDHSGVSVTAGTGLTGGGTIAATRTLNVIGGIGITANANDIAIDSAGLVAYYNTSIVHDNLSGFVANEHIDHSGVTITAGAGMTGGGTIAATRTLNVIAGTGITVNANDVATNDGQIVHDNLSGFVANEHIDHSGVSITAGVGLTGGGTIASTRDLGIDSNEFTVYFEPHIDHDNLTNFVANEHIDHSGVTITAGAGMTGGGTIAATRTLNVIAGTGITVNANDVQTNDGEIVHDNLSGFVANEHIDHSGVTITAGAGMTGGGTIAATRTLNVIAGTGITVNANDVATNDGEIVHDNLSGFVANEHIDHSGVTITAGAGMTGGGTIAATRTLNVIAGTGITVNANDIQTNDGEIVHDNLSGFVSNEHINHTSVSITAGIGLAGGGNIASTRDLAIDSAELLAYFGGTKGFDADKLDGQHGSHYRINVYNAAGSLLN